MNIRCFFGHKWEVIKISHYNDTSYDTSGFPSTNATYKCKNCGKLMKKLYYDMGYLTKEECEIT